jgi:chloride channel protein, CIC family
MSAASTAATTTTADSDQISWRAYLGLGLAAAVLGVLTSLGVWLFNQAFSAIHNLTFNTIGGALQPIGAWTIALLPAVGGVLVALIMKFGTKPDKLTAMAHIIDGVTEHGGRLNVHDGVTFIIASVLSIGVGAPVGADTPSAMIGADIASWFGQRFHQRELFIRALVVAGVGAGISATFFAQFAAIFFAFEVVLGGFGSVVFVAPTLIAIATSAMVNFWLNGQVTQYATQVVAYHWDFTLLLYLGAALLATVAAVAYVNLLPQMKNFWTGVKVPDWVKPAIAGLILGVVGLWLPAIFGTGLSQMKQIFDGRAFPLTTLIALAMAILILTPTSLGSGFPGGVIGPALLIGSALGYAYGDIVGQLFPGLQIDPIAFAMVATAAMLAGTFHAPLFGAMMMLEMTKNYALLVPVLFGAALAYALARKFQPGSAYTFTLPGAGIHLTRGTFTVDRPQE